MTYKKKTGVLTYLDYKESMSVNYAKKIDW